MIDRYGIDCIIDKPRLLDDRQWKSYTRNLPGQLYPPDQQCRLMHGDTSFMSRKLLQERVSVLCLAKCRLRFVLHDGNPKRHSSFLNRILLQKIEGLRNVDQLFLNISCKGLLRHIDLCLYLLPCEMDQAPFYISKANHIYFFHRKYFHRKQYSQLHV